MARADNVKIFEDTIALCRKNDRLVRETEQTIASQKLILENDMLPVIKKAVFAQPVQIVVSKKRSYDAALKYKGQKVCVLNFASASNPGGGVERGANAQEECLCRCSNLYLCLSTEKIWDGFYQPHRDAQNPIHNDDIIYTPNVTVFKSDTSNPERLDEEEWYGVNVISCAAPNLRVNPSNLYNQGDGHKTVIISDKNLQELHEKRLRRILNVALIEGNDVVILGAFGCGAFANNPEVVAAAAKAVISEYEYAFKTIEFAVYCNPKDEKNYNIFQRILEEGK